MHHHEAIVATHLHIGLDDLGPKVDRPSERLERVRGTSADWPRWAMTRGREVLRHGLVSGASTATPSFASNAQIVAVRDWIGIIICANRGSQLEDGGGRTAMEAPRGVDATSADGDGRSPPPETGAAAGPSERFDPQERARLHAIEMNKPAPGLLRRRRPGKWRRWA